MRNSTSKTRAPRSIAAVSGGIIAGGASQLTEFDTISNVFEVADTVVGDVAKLLNPVEAERQSEMRFDPLSGRWTILSPGRNNRPMEYVPNVETLSNGTCPFCAGHESQTPRPVWVSMDDADDCDAEGHPEPRWSVRVVPNKFPAVTGIVGKALEPSTDKSGSLFRSRPVNGGHEVVIESPHHVRSISQLNLRSVIETFTAYRDRMRFWNRTGHIGYVSVFKNVGPDAGASLSHSHSQVVATDHVPNNVLSTVANMQRYRAQTGCCLQCEVVRQEIKARSRVVNLNDDLIAYCPYASDHPMKLRITSRQHIGCFVDLNDDLLAGAARLLWRSVSLLESILGDVAYNYIIHSRPARLSDPTDSSHWSIDLIPRTGKIAGFEWNTGMMINPVPPETAAARYRDAAAGGRWQFPQ